MDGHTVKRREVEYTKESRFRQTHPTKSRDLDPSQEARYSKAQGLGLDTELRSTILSRSMF